MTRTVEAVLPVLGRVTLELTPTPRGVSLRASAGILRAPEAVLTADECMTLARELLRAAAASIEASGTLESIKAIDSPVNVARAKAHP